MLRASELLSSRLNSVITEDPRGLGSLTRSKRINWCVSQFILSKGVGVPCTFNFKWLKLVRFIGLVVNQVANLEFSFNCYSVCFAMVQWTLNQSSIRILHRPLDIIKYLNRILISKIKFKQLFRLCLEVLRPRHPAAVDCLLPVVAIQRYPFVQFMFWYFWGPLEKCKVLVVSFLFLILFILYCSCDVNCLISYVLARLLVLSWFASLADRHVWLEQVGGFVCVWTDNSYGLAIRLKVVRASWFYDGL